MMRWTVIPFIARMQKGHYDRVNDAVYDLLQRKDVLSREAILEQAEA